MRCTEKLFLFKAPEEVNYYEEFQPPPTSSPTATQNQVLFLMMNVFRLTLHEWKLINSKLLTDAVLRCRLLCHLEPQNFMSKQQKIYRLSDL